MNLKVQKERGNSTASKVGIFASSLLFAIMMVYVFAPVIGSYADTSQEADVNLLVAAGIGIGVSAENINLNATPSSFTHGSVDVSVATNSQYGYTLSIEDADNSSNMTSSVVSDVVSSGYSGSKTSSTMADNSWGYSINDTDFYAVPVNGLPVALKRTSNLMAAEYETTPVYFGVKVGMYLPATTYTDIVRFTAYVNGVDREPVDKDPRVDDNPKITIHDIDDLQEIRPTICYNTQVGDSETLTDSRDGNVYTVKKLDDGRCWMTENLRLSDITITPEDSDVNKSYRVPASDISKLTYYTAGSAMYLDETRGAYYNWIAATAGFGNYEMTSGNSPVSICPRGWELPTGGEGGMFEALYNSGYNSAALMQSGPGFKYDGVVYLGELVGVDEYGRYWSSTAYSQWTANDLYIGEIGADTLSSYGKYNGYPIHCVAR